MIYKLLFAIALALGVFASNALAEEGSDIRDAHREAAQRFFSSFADGVRLTGSVIQNESEGEFTALFYGDEWLVEQAFGEIEYTSYSNKDEVWSGSNYNLPYKLEPEDNPASLVMNLISGGQYIEDKYWDYFTYLGEDAGGYNFSFAIPGFPTVSLVLYSDPEEEMYLQIMSSEIDIAENDPESFRHRSYYYYSVDDEGRMLTSRETGNEIDSNGESVNFIDFVVEKTEPLTERPTELDFDTSRVPVGGLVEPFDGPVVVETDTSKGFFLIPIVFEGSDKTHYFMFDTGATTALFTPQAVEDSGLASTLNVPGLGHGSLVDFSLGMCRTASVQTADGSVLPLSGFPATMIPEESKEVLAVMDFYGASGIIGVNLLHQYIVSFDHPKNALEFYHPATFVPQEQLSTPNLELWLDVEDLVYCQGRVADLVEGEVVIDTGLQQDLALLGETLDNNGLELEKQGERNSTVIGGVKSFDYVGVPSFELGPLRMENRVASVTDDNRGNYTARGLLGFVGITMFFNVRVTMDLFSQRMYIEDTMGTGIFDGLFGPEEMEDVPDGGLIEQASAALPGS